ncbi:glutathione S-transferase C-terminal domain-containing protein [Streptomyces winkii]|uniref:glutathione S-transferase C-terminal domain-containing protein n=1 Tax=Streptomyces winkii TaxID=3051178 RepID=UPI0028D7ED61|nr:glutathione S-transferase C-terminal domain-containing protein [Streptomyces sp. DSM 40971]
MPSEMTSSTAYAIRGRIGPGPASGFYAAPQRYQLYLSRSCPHCLRIAVTHSLLSLGETVPLTLLPALPDAAGGYAALAPLYEATWHGHAGPAAAPVLSDGWTGRIVSNHAPDIMRDLAVRFRGSGPELYPAAADAEIGAMTRFLDEDLTAAAQRAGRHDGESVEALRTLFSALHRVEDILADQPFLMGEELTAADVHLWVALLELDTVHRWHLDAAAVHRIADRTRLWSYARRLRDEPAFHEHLCVEDIERSHHHRCRGREAAGAAVAIIDWTPSCVPASPPASPHL